MFDDFIVELLNKVSVWTERVEGTLSKLEAEIKKLQEKVEVLEKDPKIVNHYYTNPVQPVHPINPYPHYPVWTSGETRGNIK